MSGRMSEEEFRNFMKQNKKSGTSDEKYDVIYIENETIHMISYWRECDYDRAIRLAVREEHGMRGETGIIKTGKGRVGATITRINNSKEYEIKLI